MGPARDLSQLGGMPEMPTLEEQRRSASMQLAINSGIPFTTAEELTDAADSIEQYLVRGYEDIPASALSTSPQLAL